MRPFAILGLLVSLTACQSIGDTVGGIVGNPADGLFDLFGDTISFKSNPNRPVPESDTIRRAMGEDVQSEPMLSEGGNIWPVMPRQEPTMQDLQKAPPPVGQKPAPVQGSSTPPAPMPVAPVAAAPAPVPSVAAPAIIVPGTAVATPKGNAIITNGQNGIMSYTLPSGATGRAIDNGNGTMTLIGADGQVISVPAPR